MPVMIDNKVGHVREIRVGRALGLDLSFVPSAVVGYLVLWVAFGLVGILVFHRSLLAAVTGGALLSALHALSELLHNVGHATAARRTGHPMTGLRYWGIFGTSVYPADEGRLPAGVHLRRAVGGPIGSLVTAVAAGLLTLGVYLVSSRLAWIPLIFFLDNLLVFVLGNFVPVGFNDASTVIRWMGQRRAAQG